jgi:hypothetical protein
MPDAVVVDTPVGQDTPNDGAKPTSTPGSQTTSSSSTPASAPVDKAAEERNRGILADLQKERKQRQEYEKQLASITSERDQERRRVQALAGINPQSGEEAEAEQIRQKLFQLVPVLGKLTDKQVDRLLKLADSGDSLEQATNHHWTTHGRQMLDMVTGAAEKSMGGKLSERQSNRIKAAYVQEAENSQVDERGNAVPGSFLYRHNMGDPTLIEEFIKDWNEDWFEPAKRNAQAGAVNQFRRVPSGRDRSIAQVGEKPIDVNDASAVEDLLVKGFRERGGEFGRR